MDKYILWETPSSSSASSSSSHISSHLSPVRNQKFELVNVNPGWPLSLDSLSRTKHILYIQMQLCSSNLRDWLDHSHAQPSSFEKPTACSSSDSSSTNPPDNMLRKCQVVDIFRQILFGLDYLHSNLYCHRDLKPENIFLSPRRTASASCPSLSSSPTASHTSPMLTSYDVHIGDFGLATSQHAPAVDELPMLSTSDPAATVYRNFHTMGVGTAIYSSPEQLRGDIYSSKTDVFSLGIILFEMLSGFTTEHQRITAIVSLTEKRQLPRHFVKEWRDFSSLILKMTSVDPNDRPSTGELLQHPLFANPAGEFSTDSIVLSPPHQMPVSLPSSPSQLGADDVTMHYQLCSSNEEEIGLLKEQVQQQQDEINRLRRQLRAKQILSSSLHSSSSLFNIHHNVHDL
eukprot:CAMPEP_0201562496 /NCGR_PEP_ID=MMETSP0173_2-20130828/79362_1 /ASSEMBLY_ACC=CAM_ASM_000268 /TAXON_ID=218659 /ORGANISM="Vexillifera sp., Strain DIVA3 564/2" /LENGTH=400 /DNA_ID=CAMNT_0047977069 /DNA_START=781 /DNA_END=1981 /DNA_ORIENTATION=-